MPKIVLSQLQASQYLMYEVVPSGQLLYVDGFSTINGVPLNTSETRKFLLQNNSIAPAWSTLNDGDIPDVLTLNQVSNLTSNGIITTSGSNGTLVIDTTTIPALQNEIDAVLDITIGLSL